MESEFPETGVGKAITDYAGSSQHLKINAINKDAELLKVERHNYPLFVGQF